jgi:hypothetical protein
MATLCIEGFGGFVASTAAPIATGWSDQVAGRDLHPLKIRAFSRRTRKPTVGEAVRGTDRRISGKDGRSPSFIAQNHGVEILFYAMLLGPTAYSTQSMAR